MAAAKFDVLIIGGGASGLMAAVVAAEAGKRVLVLEKNPTIGQKLAITGGGRCNILNAEPDTRALLSHYGSAADFLYSPFAQHAMQNSWDFFTSRGLPLKVEGLLRAFPVSERAPDVVAFFTRLLAELGVVVQTGVTVRSLAQKDGRITGVVTDSGIVTARTYILATGGLSHQETGSTGDGHSWLAALGHTVHHPNPALVPLIATEAWIHALSGTTVPEARVTFRRADGLGAPVSCTGRILFTHFGLSGPTILNTAALVQDLLQHWPVAATIDLFPGADDRELKTTWQALFIAHQNKSLRNALKYFVPAGTARGISLLLSETLLATKLHSVSREDRTMLRTLVRNLPCTITSTKGDDWAIVSDGGLDLREIDTKTMRSKHYANLFVTGDVLHISRPSGGYSLQLCWTTGWVAGTHAG